MKNKILAIMIILILGCFSACSKKETNKTEENNPEEVKTEITSEQESSTVEEDTTEWVNEYIENYKVVSKQEINLFMDQLVEWDTLFLQNALYGMEFQGNEGVEAAIAIATLTDIADETYYGDYARETEICLKINEILEHNGVGKTFKVNAELTTNDDVLWVLQDDGTYTINIHPRSVPFAEVGSKYVVYLTYDIYGVLYASALSLPFTHDGIYTETIAIGNDQHAYMSAETLWYYDIISSYYFEQWAKYEDDKQMYEALGVDVFDKDFILWKIDEIE